MKHAIKVLFIMLLVFLVPAFVSANSVTTVDTKFVSVTGIVRAAIHRTITVFSEIPTVTLEVVERGKIVSLGEMTWGCKIHLDGNMKFYDDFLRDTEGLVGKKITAVARIDIRRFTIRTYHEEVHEMCDELWISVLNDAEEGK